MKNARRAAAAGHKTTQRRRRPPVRWRTALLTTLGQQDFYFGNNFCQMQLAESDNISQKFDIHYLSANDANHCKTFDGDP